MEIKEFTVTLKVRALVNTNPNFPENVHAIEIVENIIQNAKSQVIRAIGYAETREVKNEKLITHLNNKLATFEEIEKTLS